MRSPRRGSTLNSSWLALALAGALTVATPVSARLAGERAAVPAPAPSLGPAGAFADAATPTESLGAPTDPERDRRVREVESPAVRPHLLVRAEPGIMAFAHPTVGSRSFGQVAAVSRYYREPLVWWIEEVVRRGGQRWGRLELPYVSPRRDGWVRLAGLAADTTWVTVRVDLSEHRVIVERRGQVVLRAPGATGAAVSPTPPGRYVVTDRVPFAAGSYLGSFAFGISGIQPRLPPGWSGGDQLAIHGTNSPSTIGTSASAGCIRVSERTLDRLRPLLRQGTPVIIVR
jgi:hypothetical protein